MQRTDLQVVRAFADAHPAGVARILEQSAQGDAASLLWSLPPGSAAGVLLDMVPLYAARLLERAPRKLGAEIVAELPLDSAAALLRRTPPSAQKELLSANGDQARARSLGELLSHDAGTAGALMDPLVLALPEELDADSAMALVRSEPERAMYYLYVVGDRGRLVGVVNQRQLMLATPKTLLPSIMTSEPDSLLANAGREAIASHPAWQRVHALPVVDRGGLFLGAIRYEMLRRLERDLGRGARQVDARATAAALAELYGLGLGGIVEWASATVRGPAPGRRRGRTR